MRTLETIKYSVVQSSSLNLNSHHVIDHKLLNSAFKLEETGRKDKPQVSLLSSDAHRMLPFYYLAKTAGIHRK